MDFLTSESWYHILAIVISTFIIIKTFLYMNVKPLRRILTVRFNNCFYKYVQNALAMATLPITATKGTTIIPVPRVSHISKKLIVRFS